MAARIVYDGVRAGEGGGGTLFEGIIFHILQRTPMIDHITQLVEANGGILTKLEKTADIVITDHLRAAPEGSISYTYVTESVKMSKLQNLEDHKAGTEAVKTKSRPGSTSIPRPAQPQPARSGRVPFTHSDDKILMDWVVQSERNGAQIKGNKIYKELELQHPHHTYQSWRDRWVKHVQFRARPPLNHDEAHEESQVIVSFPRPQAAKPVSRRIEIEYARNSPIISASKPTASSVNTRSSRTALKNQKPMLATDDEKSDVENPRTDRPPPSADNDFTKAEVDKLLAEYDAILDLDEDHVIDAWIAWAAAYPRHTPQEWRNYFNKNVRGVYKPQKRKHSPIVESSLSPPNVSHNAHKLSPRESSSPLRRSPRNMNGKVKPIQDEVRLASIQEVKDSQGSSNRTISSAETRNPQKLRSEEEEFFNQNVRFLADALFPGYVVDLAPTICGSRISLYRLWVTVASEEFVGVNELDEQGRWPDVAKHLDYDTNLREQAGSELRVCYNELLVHLNDYLENSDEVTASQADEMVAEQLQQTAIEADQREELDDGEQGEDEEEEEEEEEKEEEALDDDLGAPQFSPFVPVPMKRPNTIDLTPANRKRQRIDKGKGIARDILEIPSTPEEEIRSFHMPRYIEPSPLGKRSYQVDESAVEDEADEELWNQATKSPTRSKVKPNPKPKNARLKSDPKTQDFHFRDSASQDEDEEKEQELPPSSSLLQTKSKKLPIHSTSNSQRRSSLGSNRSSARRHSGPSQADSSTQSRNPSTQGLRETIEYYEGLYDTEIIGQALRSTCLNAGIKAGEVMEALTNGKGIPEDVEGVWTERDDADLERWTIEKNGKGKGLEREKGKGRLAYERLVEKHGREGVKERKTFLKNYEE